MLWNKTLKTKEPEGSSQRSNVTYIFRSSRIGPDTTKCPRCGSQLWSDDGNVYCFMCGELEFHGKNYKYTRGL